MDDALGGGEGVGRQAVAAGGAGIGLRERSARTPRREGVGRERTAAPERGPRVCSLLRTNLPWRVAILGIRCICCDEVDAVEGRKRPDARKHGLIYPSPSRWPLPVTRRTAAGPDRIGACQTDALQPRLLTRIRQIVLRGNAALDRRTRSWRRGVYRNDSCSFVALWRHRIRR